MVTATQSKADTGNTKSTTKATNGSSNGTRKTAAKSPKSAPGRKSDGRFRKQRQSQLPAWLTAAVSVVGVGVAVGAGLYATRRQWMSKAEQWRDEFSAAFADDETDYENFDQTRNAGKDSMRDHPGDDWEDIDDMSDASFPASDPPSFTPVVPEDAKVASVQPKLNEDALPGFEARLQPEPEWQPRYPGSGRLDGKVALITGADSGIGRAVAVLFAREGADIAIAYLSEHEDAENTKNAVESEGRKAIIVAGDIGHPDFCRKLVQETADKLGRIDILINNAGEQHPDKDIRDITDHQLQRTFQTNVFGMFYLDAGGARLYSEGWRNYQLHQRSNVRGVERALDYSSTKGAVTAFTRSLSENLVSKGIRVNGVAPGPIWTPLNPMGGSPPEDIPEFGKSTPMGRPGQPNEVAPSFLFLACDDSGYMSGQVLHPNGGTIVNG